MGHHVSRTIRGPSQVILNHVRMVHVDNVLDHIDSKWILHKTLGVISDSSNQPHFLFTRGVVNTSLKNTAAMAVGVDFNATSDWQWR